MFAKKKKKGFTLIELLVVIAIIGILAGIVLVSLTGARNKGKDARILSDLTQTRSIAELIADSETTGYTNLCASGALNTSHSAYGSQLTTLGNDITSQGGTSLACQASSTHYCVSVTNASGKTVCISDAGAVENDKVCSATTYACATP